MKILLTGDVNLMNVADPATPFRRTAGDLHAADVLFGNLECCLYLPPSPQSLASEGFFADPRTGGEALRLGGFHAVGIANNVNYGAANIMASIARLDTIVTFGHRQALLQQQYSHPAPTAGAGTPWWKIAGVAAVVPVGETVTL